MTLLNEISPLQSVIRMSIVVIISISSDSIKECPQNCVQNLAYQVDKIWGRLLVSMEGKSINL